MIQQKLLSIIRDVPDFPKPGILFKDITPIIMDPQVSREVVDEFKNQLANIKIDAVAGVESRGFLFGFQLALALNVPFILVRKAGKLPYKTMSCEYALEYGSAKVEMHIDSIKENWNVLIHDDLLATGGTANAAGQLVEMQGGKVAGFCFLVELEFLKGKEKLRSFSDNIISLVTY